MSTLELSDKIKGFGFNEIYYDNEYIEIHFTDTNNRDEIIKIPVLEYQHDTILQLDPYFKSGQLSSEQWTQIQYYLTIELAKVWDDIHIPNTTDKQNESKENREQDTKIKIALEVAQSHTQKLFIDEYKIPYATVSIDDHLEVFPINSKNFRNWCRMKIYENQGQVINSETLKDMCSLLSAQAQFKNKEQINLHLRTASKVNNGEIEWYYDLTNRHWEFIKITSSYWDIIKNEILFKRYNNQQPQVYPVKDYEPDVFDKFMKLVNIKADDEDSKLNLKIYIVSLCIPEIQKPVLMLHGSQGSAKSSLQEMIKMLVDPSAVKTFSFPRDINELIQQLNHNQIVYYDNISIIKDYISDQLCRAVSGSGSSKRQLYTDDDEMIYSFKRCVGFNGINLGATKPDLLDRGLIIELERIDESKQLKPEDLWKQFNELRPQLLGYILDILVKVLQWKNNRNRPELVLDRLPRMAEFAEYGEIISRCMGNPSNLFINAYRKNIQLQSREVIDSSSIAPTIIQFMTRRNDEDWIGNATSLLSELAYDADTLKIDTKSKYWPKSANSLSRRLKEIKVNLKQVGIDIEYGHDGKQRIITIRKISLIPLIPLKDPNQAQIDSQNTNDITNDIDNTNDISLSKTTENHAQNDSPNDINDTNDIIQVVNTSVIPRTNTENENLTSQNTGSHRSFRSHGNITASTIVKCPDCDYTAVPYDMRIHREQTGHRHYSEGL
jgi:hypothetical protein